MVMGSLMRQKRPASCICGEDGKRCHVCLTAIVMGMRLTYSEVTVSLVRRVLRDELTGREIALLLEAMRYMR